MDVCFQGSMAEVSKEYLRKYQSDYKPEKRMSTVACRAIHKKEQKYIRRITYALI